MKKGEQIKMETDVTIVSINLNNKILEKYSDYFLVERNFKIEDLLSKDKIIFYNALNGLSLQKIKDILARLKEKNIKYINLTNDMEEVLATNYLIIYDKNKILIEGKTLEVLKEEKVLKRIGLELPFIVELSHLLKDYGLIDELYLDKESLVDELWK